MQCKGITQKGLRCRIQGKTEYCHYHSHQSVSKAIKLKSVKASTYTPVDKQGYIYIHTLAKTDEATVFDEKSETYKAIKRGFWDWLFSREKVLIKVGFTTRTPQERMAQWEVQCNHRLMPVVPKKRRHAPHYDSQKNGWASKSAFKVEQNILAQLRQQYGTGHVQCGNCIANARSGIHIEWFLLPKRHVKDVFKVIETSII